MGDIQFFFDRKEAEGSKEKGIVLNIKTNVQKTIFLVQFTSRANMGPIALN